MKYLKASLSISWLLTFFTMVQSSAQESYQNYQSIVNELSSSQNELGITDSSSVNSLDQIKFHAAAGIVTSKLNLDLPGGLPESTNLKGQEVTLGIDLFSPNWAAIGMYRNYQPEKFIGGEIKLQQFDLLIQHRHRLQQRLSLLVSGGLSSRYLDLQGSIPPEVARSHTTPSTAVELGLDFAFTPGFSMGGFVSHRSRLIDETIDRSAIDGAVRVAGHF